jgi:HlyD family secretion protein
MKRSVGRTTSGWIITLAIVVVVLGGGSWLALTFLRPHVQVTRTVEGPVVQAFYSTGTVQPEREYPIRANHAGIITQLLVDKGDTVKKDQVLAVVEEKELQYQLDKAAAELKEKKARADEKTSPVIREFDARIAANAEILEIARREQKRLEGLSETSSASPTDVDRAIDRVKQVWGEYEGLKAQRATKLLELRREVEVAESAVATAQWNLDRQTVRSPIDGVVLDWPVPLGTRLAVNDHIMQVADVRPQNLVMRAQVDEEDKTKVTQGQVVRMTLYAFPGEVFQGKVYRIFPQADAELRTFEIDVKLEKPVDTFAAGMTGELAFIMAERGPVTVIPSQAVQKETVYVVRNGKVTRADVKIGIRSIERVEVQSGLAADELVLLSPIGGLREGQSVRITEIDPKTAAALNKQQIDVPRMSGLTN